MSVHLFNKDKYMLIPEIYLMADVSLNVTIPKISSV